ncbi:MAG: type II secretion system protein GspD [Cyanobacteria bacterium NC_groundwater_1444_Ag_S-0.65um_54_12]|nr:type II secretion system protein GspD [Cyanobacteria bacterium NC_groundwater_1444_Ag_S-0.65um_54_12]
MERPRCNQGVKAGLIAKLLAIGLALTLIPSFASAQHSPNSKLTRTGKAAVKNGKNAKLPPAGGPQRKEKASSKLNLEPASLLVPQLRKPPEQTDSLPSPTPHPMPETITLPASNVDDSISLSPRLNLPGGYDKIFLRARGLPMQEVLAAIAEMKNLNLIIDPSVSGTVAVDFLDVSLNQVMETLIYTNALTLQKIGASYIVYRSGRYGQALIKFIPVHFTRASELVEKITTIIGATGLSGATNTGGSAGGSGGSGGGGASNGGFSPIFKLIADARINSLIIHGTTEDIAIVEKLARRLDVLLPSKIFRLTHLTPMEAITLLRNSYFVGAGQGGGTVAVQGGGAGSAAGGGAGSAGGASGGAGGGAAGAGGTPFSVDELDFAKGSGLKQINVEVGEATPRFIPLVRDNNLLVIGSKEELALVEQILPRIDHKRRQVLLRTQIIELSEDGQRELGTTIQQLFPRGLGLSANTLNGLSFNLNLANAQTVAQVQLAISALVRSNKAKILASPAVLAMDNRNSTITSNEQILSGVQTQTTGIGNSAQVTQTPIFSNVGIKLEITPRILLDNSINLYIHPVVSFPGRTVTVGGNVLTTSTVREYQTQELRVKDSETIVIGGLIQERQDDTLVKVPLLGDIPIIGAFFSRSTAATVRSEIQIYITPEIQPDA